VGDSLPWLPNRLQFAGGIMDDRRHGKQRVAGKGLQKARISPAGQICKNAAAPGFAVRLAAIK
jgi:hypothetical protein